MTELLAGYFFLPSSCGRKIKGMLHKLMSQKGEENFLKGLFDGNKQYLQIHYYGKIVILSCSLQSHQEISHGQTANTLKVQMSIQNV